MMRLDSDEESFLGLERLSGGGLIVAVAGAGFLVGVVIWGLALLMTVNVMDEAVDGLGVATLQPVDCETEDADLTVEEQAALAEQCETQSPSATQEPAPALNRADITRTDLKGVDRNA